RAEPVPERRPRATSSPVSALLRRRNGGPASTRTLLGYPPKWGSQCACGAAPGARVNPARFPLSARPQRGAGRDGMRSSLGGADVEIALGKGNLDAIVQEGGANGIVERARDRFLVPRVGDPDLQLEVQRRFSEAGELHLGRRICQDVGGG